MHKNSAVWLLCAIFSVLVKLSVSVTMKQFEASLDMMRSGCAPKFKLNTDQLENLRKGKFEDNNMDLKCYTKCIAQLAGTLTKKGEFSFQKALAQIPIILPTEIQDSAKKALDACIDVQKNYSDSCEKMYYTTKCVYEFDPKNFKFP